jgi:hypothetical protein
MFETIIIILLIIFIIIYKFKYKSPIKTVDSFNNIKYIVNDLPDAQEASDTLAKIMIVLNILVNRIIDDYDNTKIIKTEDDIKYINYIRVIKERLPNVKISENPTDSLYTSYSVNKGEELVLCIRDNKKYSIHQLNELLYVAIHEIAHIGCPEIGHTRKFQLINIYLLKKAINYNLYKYIDYKKYNKKYCGMLLTSTII